MQDSFGITVFTIIIVALVITFIRGRTLDKCLKDFIGFNITLEKINGKIIWGKLLLAITGFELIFKKMHNNKTSYILYKPEYSQVQSLIRFHNDLTEKNKLKREKDLKKTYHPNFLRILLRKLGNIFKTVRDSLIELFDLMIGHVKKINPTGMFLNNQDKNISRIKQEVVGTVASSYDPILERYIGKKVIIEIQKASEKFEYKGVLKDYTSEFIEILDVDYKLTHDQEKGKADLIVSRKLGIIRHLAE